VVGVLFFFVVFFFFFVFLSSFVLVPCSFCWADHGGIGAS